MIMMIIAAICGLVLVQPAWLGSTFSGEPGSWTNPLGAMWLKFIAIFVLVLTGAYLVMVDTIVLSDKKEGEWGNLSRASRAAATSTGVVGIWIVMVMGFVRESARSPFTIYDVIPVPGGQSYPTPLPLEQIFIIWAVILIMVVGIFWFTSKVTSHHPEQAEQI